MREFINLHTNSEYSFLDSLIRINDLVQYAKENNLKTLVLTDTNFHGADKFYFLCKKNNIKAVLGLDIEVDHKRVILLAKNTSGFRSLMLFSESNRNGLEISLNQLEKTQDDLIIINHPRLGFSMDEIAQSSIKNFYNTSNNDQDPLSLYVVENKLFNVKDNPILEMLNSTNNNQKNKGIEFKGFSHYAPISELMQKRINDIVDQCNFEYKKPEITLPKFMNNLGISSKDFLVKILKESWHEKSHKLQKYDNAKQRIKYELSVISKLGFEDYFLIIWDIINWAKKNKIAIGPGRGSASGSLVSYLLNITEVNPLEFNLFFERFLNEDRISMPDIDIDVQDNRRDELLNYIFEKYGKQNVSTISTFQFLGAKSSIRDVGRFLGINIAKINEISKHIDAQQSLAEQYENNQSLRSYLQNQEDPIFKKLIDFAMKIEGLPRQTGTHAAGIIISNKKINNYIPTFIVNNKNQSQYSMENIEKMGFLKIDFLGLKTLSTITHIEERIAQFEQIDFDKINSYIIDEKIKKVLENKSTLGIFQIESPGMTNTINKINVDDFKDIYAAISLYRPGPLKFISVYAKNKKNPKNIKKIIEPYDNIVKDTYGIIVYQEQIMEIAQKVSGFKFTEADVLRKAISKKDITLLDEMKAKFIQGGIKNGHPKNVVENIYLTIEDFAQYGFNKSHAVAYAVLVYKMLYYKAHYPLFFYSSLIKTNHTNQDNLKTYFLEAKKNNIAFYSPSINNVSEQNILSKNEMFLPLIMIKGFGPAAYNKVYKDFQENGLYKSFDDFIQRAWKMELGKANIETLIKANALREFGNMKDLLTLFKEVIEDKFEIVSKLAKVQGDDIDISNFFQLEFSKNSSRDIEFERKNEEEYLGYFYNSPSQNENSNQNLENEDLTINLKNMHPGTEHVLDILITQKKSIMTKDDHLIKRLEFEDDSMKAMSWINEQNEENFKDIKVGKRYRVEILKPMNQKTFIIKKIRGILND